MANSRGVKRERNDDGFTERDHSNDGTPSPSPSQKRGKFERSFVPSWLDRFDWLVYDNHRNMMFCDLCRKYRKNNAFTEGCQNFRRDNLNKHMATNDHKYCVEQEALNKSGGSVEHRTADVGAASPLTPGRHSSTDSSRSSGIFSLTSSSLPQSPASMALPSPPSFAPARSPLSTLHAPVPLLEFPLLPLPPPLFAPYMEHNARLHYGEANGESKPKDNLTMTPNYLAHPPFPYLSGSSSFRPPEPASTVSAGQRAHPPQPAENTQTNGPCIEENELVLKVRVANAVEKDFIEIEIDRSKLTFDFVLSSVCRELNVNPTIVHKLRKLPNTIVRKDKDVRRFVDFQELELVLTNSANSESSRNYGPSVSPRHVDVVY